MATGHRPGDRNHVNYALTVPDLATEKAVKDYVADLLDRYDSVELYHFNSGTELTFRHAPGGKIITSRRTLRAGKT
jgi:hypothetical protein